CLSTAFGCQRGAFFFRSLVRFGFSAVTAFAAADLDAWAFFCLLASIACFSFSGNPLFLAALLLALVNDFAANGILIENPYFSLYSFWFMPWETRCFDVSCLISAPHSRQITLSFWMESAGLSFVAAASSATGWETSMSIPAVSAFSNSWSVTKTCRRDE